jgi:hypothetical protein
MNYKDFDWITLDPDLYWKRVDNLSRAMKKAQDPSFKRLWEDKLQLLMQNQPKSLTKH